MSEDIRTLLASRPRAKVNRRETTLKTSLNNNHSVEESEIFYEGPDEISKKFISQQIETTVSISQQEPSLSEKQQLEQELNNFPLIGKRLAIHLEQEVRNDLLKLCDEQEITPETFIEATVILVKEKPNLVKQIIKEAKRRLSERKRAGLLRRTLSLMDKFRD